METERQWWWRWRARLSRADLGWNPSPSTPSMTLRVLFSDPSICVWGWGGRGGREWIASSQNSRPLETQNVLGASEWGKGYHRGHGGICHHLLAESIHLSSDLRPTEVGAELRGDFHFVWEVAAPGNGLSEGIWGWKTTAACTLWYAVSAPQYPCRPWKGWPASWSWESHQTSLGPGFFICKQR